MKETSAPDAAISLGAAPFSRVSISSDIQLKFGTGVDVANGLEGMLAASGLEGSVSGGGVDSNWLDSDCVLTFISFRKFISPTMNYSKKFAFDTLLTDGRWNGETRALCRGDTVLYVS